MGCGPNGLHRSGGAHTRERDHNLLSGPLAIVLTIVAIAIQSGEPGTKASGAEIASYFTDHKTQVTVSTILFAISAALLVLFGARLRERWREQAPSTAPCP